MLQGFSPDFLEKKGGKDSEQLLRKDTEKKSFSSFVAIA